MTSQTLKEKKKELKHRHRMEYNGMDMGCAACSEMYKTNKIVALISDLQKDLILAIYDHT